MRLTNRDNLLKFYHPGEESKMLNNSYKILTLP